MPAKSRPRDTTHAALVCAFVGVIFSTGAYAASGMCERNRLALEYGGHICLNGACQELHQKWKFLGRHLYLYASLPEERGVIWDIDNPTNMMTNGSDPDFLPHITRYESQTARGTVVMSGNDVALSRHVQVKDARGKVEADTWLRIAVRINSCSDCELITYEMSGESGYVPSQSTITQKWCRVL